MVFPPPSPPCSRQCCAKGSGKGVWILLFSEVTLFEFKVSSNLSPIVAFV